MDKVKWFIKSSIQGSYVEMPQPSKFDIEVTDLDNNSYRSITTGNLIDSVISKNWSKCKFVFEHIDYDTTHNLIQKCSNNPIYAKIENPIYSSGFLEGEFRCSKKSISKSLVANQRYTLELNLVQKTKVGGQ